MDAKKPREQSRRDASCKEQGQRTDLPWPSTIPGASNRGRRESYSDVSFYGVVRNRTMTVSARSHLVELQCLALFPLDDLAVVVRRFINLAVSYVGQERVIATCVATVVANL